MDLHVTGRAGSRTIRFFPMARNKSSDTPGVFFLFLFCQVPELAFHLPAGSLVAIPGVSGSHIKARVNNKLLPATHLS